MEGRLTGIIETVPTFRSLTVIFDPLVLPRSALKERLTSLVSETDDCLQKPSRLWRLPVCYGGEFGPDLDPVAEAKGLSLKQVIDLHINQVYLVYMIGFLPGFPFMGDVAPALEMPRLRDPRVRVPAGSVAMTGQQTAIYPWESPGGWQLLGRCPLALFDAERHEPALLAPGDRVEFQAITADHYQELFERGQIGVLDLSQFLIEEVKS